MDINDFRIGIKHGRLFFHGIARCCHGRVMDQVLAWMPLEFKNKFKNVENLDGIDYDFLLYTESNEGIYGKSTKFKKNR